MRGYLHSGFADVKVVVSTAPSHGAVTATIDKGHQQTLVSVCSTH